MHFLCVLDSRMSSKGSFIPWAARYGRSAAQRTAPGFFRAGFYKAAPSGSLTGTERWLYDNCRGTFVFDAATLEQTNTYFLYQSVYRRVRIMNRIIIELLISTFLFFAFLFTLIRSHLNQCHKNKIMIYISIIGLVSTIIAIICCIISLALK